MKWKSAMVMGVLLALGALGALLGLTALDEGKDEVREASAASVTDVFRGTLTGAQIGEGDFSATGVYDMNCTPIAGGLTRCDGGIEIGRYGVLNFRYSHDMQKEACLAPGDQLTVKVLDAKGAAMVQRARS